MNLFRPATRFSALLLLVLTVHVVAHSLLLPNHELTVLQNQTVSTAFFTTDNESDGEARLGNNRKVAGVPNLPLSSQPTTEEPAL